MKLFLTAFILLFFLSFNTYSASLGSEADTKLHTEKILQSIIDYKLEDTEKLLNAYSKISKNQVKAFIEKIAFQRKQIGITSGYKYEFVDMKKVGKSLVRYRYLEKTESVPMVWYFFYYEDKSGWALIKFEYNDEQEMLFD